MGGAFQNQSSTSGTESSVITAAPSSSDACTPPPLTKLARFGGARDAENRAWSGTEELGGHEFCSVRICRCTCTAVQRDCPRADARHSLNQPKDHCDPTISL